MKQDIKLLSESFTVEIDVYNPEHNAYDKFTMYNTKAYNAMLIKYSNIDSINNRDARQLFKMHDENKQLYIRSKQIVNKALKLLQK